MSQNNNNSEWKTIEARQRYLPPHMRTNNVNKIGNKKLEIVDFPSLSQKKEFQNKEFLSLSQKKEFKNKEFPSLSCGRKYNSTPSFEKNNQLVEENETINSKSINNTPNLGDWAKASNEIYKPKNIEKNFDKSFDNNTNLSNLKSINKVLPIPGILAQSFLTTKDEENEQNDENEENL